MLGRRQHPVLTKQKLPAVSQVRWESFQVRVVPASSEQLVYSVEAIVLKQIVGSRRLFLLNCVLRTQRQLPCDVFLGSIPRELPMLAHTHLDEPSRGENRPCLLQH